MNGIAKIAVVAAMAVDIMATANRAMVAIPSAGLNKAADACATVTGEDATAMDAGVANVVTGAEMAATAIPMADKASRMVAVAAEAVVDGHQTIRLHHRQWRHLQLHPPQLLNPVAGGVMAKDAGVTAGPAERRRAATTRPQHHSRFRSPLHRHSRAAAAGVALMRRPRLLHGNHQNGPSAAAHVANAAATSVLIDIR